MLLGAGLALAGCSFSADSIWPALSGERGSAATEQEAPSDAPASAAVRAEPLPPAAEGPAGSPSPPPTLGAGAPGTRAAAPTSGTLVGEKIALLRADLARLKSTLERQNQAHRSLRAQTRKSTQDYHATVGAVTARLQIGTTPGNPTLISQWNSAQADLARIDNDVALMNALANDVAGTSTLSAYLLQTTRATYGLAGAVEGDHRELAVLEDEVHRTAIEIERLLTELSQDINRQLGYLGAERANLAALSLAIKSGEPLGASLAKRAPTGAVPAAARLPAAGAAGGAPKVRRPLVVIRFDRPKVSYEQALYTAVSRALDRRPGAIFDLVAVAPESGTPARVTLAMTNSKRNAESVLRSLTDMGLPLDRVRLSATTSGGATSNEVHLYVR